jgi:transposase
LERRIAALLAEHPLGHVFTSLPRAGSVNAAQILAAWGDCTEAFVGPEAVAALAGVSPVTKKSGKYHSVQFRWSCNKRFRSAITTFADNSRRASPWANEIYIRARRRGCNHAHAIRILARAWIRVIYRCWVTGQAYDASKHTAAARLGSVVHDDMMPTVDELAVA